MGRRCGCLGSVRSGDRDLRSAASVYRPAEAAMRVIRWLDANAEAIILAGVMGICWVLASVN